MRKLLQQANQNLLAIISLVVALSALGYNTYRNELTEENRNIRFAGFSLLQELAEMQQLIDYAHYDKDAVKGNPITGWQHLLYARDMSYLVSAEIVAGTEALIKVWGDEWQIVRDDESSNQRVTAAINALREQVRYIMASLE
ncbi:MAG TPA: hypothetical protein VET88_04360 [Gammaproteobacteria bacterium]|nr:hypothetical protein [Gammaproteobacteria bacterium]